MKSNPKQASEKEDTYSEDSRLIGRLVNHNPALLGVADLGRGGGGGRG
jgi:hypothetical protein